MRDLTDASEGNAVGIGFTDFATKLIEKIDREKTYINCLTGISPEKMVITMYFDTDQETLKACFSTIGRARSPSATYGSSTSRAPSTYPGSCSKAFDKEIEEMSNLRLLCGWKEMALGEDGNIISPF